jgi:hypothetical protein
MGSQVFMAFGIRDLIDTDRLNRSQGAMTKSTLNPKIEILQDLPIAVREHATTTGKKATTFAKPERGRQKSVLIGPDQVNFFTNSDFNPMDPIPLILQSMS